MLTAATRVPICNECLGSFQRIAGEVCDVCGRPQSVEPEAPAAPVEDTSFACPDCLDGETSRYGFDRARSWSIYQGAMVQAILVLKFESVEPLGALFGRLLAELTIAGGKALKLM
jgi:predicted amidophosphoribosyltransferase